MIVLLVAAVLTGCASPAAEEGPSEQVVPTSAGSVTSASPTDRDLLPLPPRLALDGDDVTVTFERMSYEWVDLAADGTLTDQIRSKEAAAAAGPCTPGATVSSPAVLTFDVIRGAGDELSLRAIRQDAGEEVQDLDVIDGTVLFDVPAGDWLLEADGRWQPEGSGGYRACVTVLDAGTASASPWNRHRTRGSSPVTSASGSHRSPRAGRATEAGSAAPPNEPTRDPLPSPPRRCPFKWSSTVRGRMSWISK